MNVIKIDNSIFSSNTYLCPTSEPGKCILIDPGLDSASIDAQIQESGLEPVGIFCTHGHFDHLGSSDFFKKKYKIPIYLHQKDLKLSQSANFLLMACKIQARITCPQIDVLVEDNFEVLMGDSVLKFIPVPGHTPGSCLIEFRKCIFTGDSLYKNGVGLVNFPGENPELLRASLLKVWDQLPDDFLIYPGHGGSGRWGEIKENNGRLRQFLGLDPSKAHAAPSTLKINARIAFEEEIQ